ncbi:MAG TPA: alanine--glyoxylate aminotransferase family protein [Xanthobacteraceae bacterium]|nr:alanine--glyoxylate aminotransferase family protein [Xanthobacteraceae bacterium]
MSTRRKEETPPARAAAAPELFAELDPEPRLLMGPGPVDVYPRVLRAMSVALQGQFDPQFTVYMNEVMALYRLVFRTANQWTFLIDGTARAGIEACLASVLAPGDKLLVPIFGRFGHLNVEIGRRLGADVAAIETEWGRVFAPEEIEAAILRHRPKLVAMSHGDTSTTMLQPLIDVGALCRKHDVLFYVDCTASLGGNPFEMDAWHIDAASAGLQKCLSGPPGSAPVTFNERIAAAVNDRKHVEQGIKVPGMDEGTGPIIRSNYFDLAMLMDYWSPRRLNHHTEAASMLYAARECARVVLGEGLDNGIARHRLASSALRAGLEAMGLTLFGDPAHRMASVTGVVIPASLGNGEAVRAQMLDDFGIEIGTSFGPLTGKIWRIGTMGYVCRKANMLRCLAALEAVLRRNGFPLPAGAAVDAAWGVYESAGSENSTASDSRT